MFVELRKNISLIFIASEKPFRDVCAYYRSPGLWKLGKPCDQILGMGVASSNTLVRDCTVGTQLLHVEEPTQVVRSK